MNVCIEAAAAEAVVTMTTVDVVVSKLVRRIGFIATAAPMLRTLLRNGKTAQSAVAPDFSLLGGTAVAV